MKESPTIDLGAIEDVDVSTRRYISKRWGNWFYVIGGTLIAVGLISLPFLGIFGAMPAILWFTIGFAIAGRAVQKEFLKQFAQANGFVFEETSSLLSVEGDLFGRGHTRTMSAIVAGVHAERALRFFFYSYDEGHGKHRSTHPFTVAEVTFGGSLPDIIVDSKDDMYVDGGFFGKFKTLKVGNGFDDYFALKVPEDLEIEALEVFTPEIMEQLMSRGRGYSFEFIGTKLYVWNTGHARKSSELRELLSLAHYLVDALAPRLARLSDDVEAYRATKR